MRGNQNKVIELSSNVKREIALLEFGKTYQVKYVLHLLKIKLTSNSTPTQKLYQAFYKDKTSNMNNFCLQIVDGTVPKVGDIHLIKSIKSVSKNNTNLFVVVSNGFEVIGHQELSQEEDEESSQLNEREVPAQPQRQSVRPQMRNSSVDLSGVQMLSHLTTFSKEFKVFVKITKKSDIKTFTNKSTGQPGKLLSFNMIDTDGFELQATAFGNAATKLEPLLTENKYYLIKGGMVRINDKRFSTSRSDYRVTYEEGTSVVEVDQEVEFKEVQMHLVFINDFPRVTLNSCVDCYVYVIEAGEKRTITTKKGNDLDMKKLTVGDSSGYQCEFTLWKNLSDLEVKEKQVLLVRYARVSEFNGRNLNSIDDTTVTINPSNPEAYNLHQFAANKKDWKQLENANGAESSYPTEITFLSEMLDKAVYDNEKSPLFKIKVTISSLTHSQKNYYMGCPTKTCKKKLSNDDNGYFCTPCNKAPEKPMVYYTLNIRVKDASTDTFVDVFGDTCAKLLGVDAEQYKDMVENENITELKEISQKTEFSTKILYGKAKIQSYNGIEKKRINVYRIEDINYSQEAKATLNYLRSLNIK